MARFDFMNKDIYQERGKKLEQENVKKENKKGISFMKNVIM